MRIIYVADDGTQFDNQIECEDYEWRLDHPHLNDVHCYDKSGKELTDIFSESTYESVIKIVVTNDLAVEALQELADYTGYCCYSNVIKPGIWKFVECGCDGKFEFISEIN